MSGGSGAFDPLKGSSLLSCTGTMDQDPSIGRPAGPGIATTARTAKGGDQGIPAPYHAALPGLFLFPEYGAEGGDRP
jgi:hypothetical protein